MKDYQTEGMGAKRQYIGYLYKFDQAALARRKRPKKRSLHEVNEHFEDAQIYKGNAASAALANL